MFQHLVRSDECSFVFFSFSGIVVFAVKVVLDTRISESRFFRYLPLGASTKCMKSELPGGARNDDG